MAVKNVDRRLSALERRRGRPHIILLYVGDLPPEERPARVAAALATATRRDTLAVFSGNCDPGEL